MSGEPDQSRRFFARSYAYLCFAAAAIAVVALGVILVVFSSTGARTAAVVVLAVFAVLLVWFGVSTLRTPYAELIGQQLVIRALWSRRTYDLSNVDRVERNGFGVQLFASSSDLPVVMVPTLILGGRAREVESIVASAAGVDPSRQP